MRRVEIDYSNTNNIINNLRSIVRNLESEQRKIKSALSELYDLENYYYNKGEIVRELEYRERQIYKDIENTETLIENINNFSRKVEEVDGSLANKFKKDIKKYAKENNIEITTGLDKFLNGIQGALDVVGFFPIVGDIADGINAVISLSRGDIGLALISLAAMIPVIGDAAKGFKYMDKASDLLKLGDKVVDIGKATAKNATKKLGQVAKKETLGIISKGEKAFKNVLNSVMDLGKGEYVAGIKNVGEVFLSKVNDVLPDGICICLDGGCLVGETLVKTKEGLKEIREIKAGDFVLSKNEELGITEYKIVKEVYRRSIYETCSIRTENGIIESTIGHLFMIKDKWWTAAIDIKENDYIELSDGIYSKIISVAYDKKSYPINIYNLSVEDNHNYYVGIDEVLTHNTAKLRVNYNLKKINYKKVFFDEYPELEGKVVVHHGVEQQILKKPQTKHLFTEEEMHSLTNLRGIPKELNSDLHLSKIRKEWNRFYKEVPNPTKEQLLNKRLEIDKKYGELFNPPVKFD